MGSLNKRIFSGVGILSALLFLIGSAMVMIDGGSISSGSNSTALYIVTVSGVLAIVYSVNMLLARESFVQTLCGVLVLLAGAVSAAVAFVGDSAGTVVAVASILAALAIIADMLSMWVSKIYGAMYISAVLAAVELFAFVMCLTNGGTTYYAVAFIVFALWLAMSAFVSGFVETENSVKTRVVVEDAVSKKEPKPQAMNKKGTKKAKKTPPKAEPSNASATPAKAAEPAKEAPKKEEPKPEAPKAEPKPSTEPAKKEEVQVKPATKTESIREAPKEVPKVEPKTEPVKEAPKAEEPKPVEKPKNDFMSKLVSSRDVNSKVPPKEPAVIEPEVSKKEEEILEEIPAEEPKAEPEEILKTEEPEVGIPIQDEPETEAEEIMVSEDVSVDEVAEEVPVQSDESQEVIELSEQPAEVATEEPASDSEGDIPEDDSEETGEDLYTDNSPEALVRRAAWNKGLRCRRGYGDHNIPVAFVKGKVAVYVTEAGADTSSDAILEGEGWTVLRFDEAAITDGKQQGEEIAAAVKAKVRETKAASKKKKKPAKK